MAAEAEATREAKAKVRRTTIQWIHYLNVDYKISALIQRFPVYKKVVGVVTVWDFLPLMRQVSVFYRCITRTCKGSPDSEIQVFLSRVKVTAAC